MGKTKMDWKDLFVVTALLNPIIILILAIAGIILLLIPIILVCAYGLMTGLIFGVVTLLFIFVMHRTGVLDIKTYPWVALTPVLTFFVGVVVEKARVFQIRPLTNFQIYPLTTLMSTTSAASATVDLTLTSIIIFIIVICLAIGLAAERSS